MQYWLMKSEPETFSIEDLRNALKQSTFWDGVRNYQARNHMRSMQVGDLVLFYHSSCKVPGVVGLAEVVSEAHPDKTAFDPKSPYYDPKSTKDNPRWHAVDIQFKEAFPETLSLTALKQEPALSSMKVVQKGQRLSVQPVTPDEFKKVLKLARRPGSGKKS
ncbi:MAG TPA: EVE domain-containing protein [Opitutae bacterium]|nr:EVE domain-containing protein [Opitutae bacterium]|tara:strand:+ start:1165 stop:1647 length:483 start_codon:yes stop_codon:yes gene_type:complete